MTGLCPPTPSVFPNKPIMLSFWLLAVLLKVSVNGYHSYHVYSFLVFSYLKVNIITFLIF